MYAVDHHATLVTTIYLNTATNPVLLAWLLQIGFILEHDYKKRVLLDGLHVARFYIIRGSFLIDSMAMLPVVYQVRLQAAACLLC